MANDYPVGYGKPPKEGQFEKGRSGNPKGRPRGSKNIATLFSQITLELIQVKENGKTKTMTRLEAVLLQMTKRALSGDPRTMREFVQFSRLFQEAEKAEPGATEPAERDAAVMASLRKRLERAGTAPDASEVDEPSKEDKTEEEFYEDGEENYA
jgi:hypothetical protein